MKNYKKAISEIKASDEFKSKLIKNLNEKQSEIYEKENIKFAKKHKVKNTIITILSILGLLGGSGLVYAGLTGNLKFGESGVEFSQNIAEYQEKVINQKLEKDGNVIELTSKVCDDGFLMLQFDITLSDDVKAFADEFGGLQYVSFNDNQSGITAVGYPEEPRLAGANYNLIIDGNEYWLRGATDSQIIENIENKNYTFYQLWFLSEEEIGNKEEFKITLDDVIIKVGEQLYNFDGKFDIDISKTKAMENTKIYTPENASIKYERLTSKIEKIIESPMQTLIKTNTTLEDITNRNYNNLDEDDYINNYLEYKVYDQNNNELSEYDVITKYVYYYKDGTTKSTDNEEGQFEWDGFYKYDTENYIAIAQNDEITNITVDIFEKNEYKGTRRNIGELNINLENGEVQSKNKNNVEIYDENSPSTWQLNTILPSQIDEFSIDIKDKNYTITRTYDKAISNGAYMEGSKEDYDVALYEIDLKDTDAFFEIVVFKNKKLYNNYEYISGDEDYKPTKISENDRYIAVLNAFTNNRENKIKNITNTIKLK